MQWTWHQFQSSLVKYFTVAVCTYSGEFELRVLACGTVYANKMDVKNRTLLGEQRGERSAVIACRIWKFCLVRVAPLEMVANSRPSTSAASEAASVEHAEVDIPGAALDEPLDMHDVAILRW